MNSRPGVRGAVNARLNIRCLGRFSIEGCSGEVSGSEARRGRQLIGYLVAHGYAVAERRVLAEAFWPDADADVTHHRLHLVASAARSTLRRALSGIEAIACVNGGYAWHPDVCVESDVARLLESARCTDPAKLREAAQYEYGEFLAGQEGDWLDPIRLRCAAARSTLLQRLAEAAYASGELDEALHRGLELTALDPAHESATRLIMNCFSRLDQPMQAYNAFVVLEQFLGRRLAIAPTHETRQLLDEILKRDRRDTVMPWTDAASIVRRRHASSGAGSHY